MVRIGCWGEDTVDGEPAQAIAGRCTEVGTAAREDAVVEHGVDVGCALGFING